MADTQYRLIVRKGPKVGETFILETFSLTIGRDPVSDVVLNDPEVSRQHARFTQTEDGYQVQDLGSTNGTFVNGQRLESESVDLQPGFTISMGSGVTMLYEAVPTGDALAATMIDQGGLGEMLELGDELTDLDEDLEAAVPDLPQMSDEPRIPSDWEPDPSPPFTPPLPDPASFEPVVAPKAAPPLVPAGNDDEAARKKRRNTIIIIATTLILLCCCAFLLFMWLRGGDLLLEYFGLI